MLKVLNAAAQTLATTAAQATGAAIPTGRAVRLSLQCNITVNTPAAVTFASTAVNTTTDTITATAHGFVTGLKGQLTTTGALPTGLSTSTDYFVIVVDANSFKLASSLANAQAGTQIDITAQGSGNDTFTPTALAGATVQLQKSNDNTNWNNDGSSVSVTATGLYWLENTAPAAQYFRVIYSLTAGTYKSTTTPFVLTDAP